MSNMNRAFVLSLLLLAAVPSQAADRCADKAAMYQLTYSLRDMGLTEAQLVTHTWMYAGFTDLERQQAVYRVRREGELGFMSAKTLYKHIIKECRSVA